MRHLLIVVAFVFVYLVLPSLHVDVSTEEIVAAGVVLVLLSLLADARRSQKHRTAQRRAAQNPTLQRLSVYIGTADGTFYALRAADGTIRWQSRLGSEAGPLAVSTTASVNSETIYVGSLDDGLYALNSQDGTLRWRYSTGGTVRSRPAAADGVVYVGSADGHLHALAASDGSFLWSFQAGGGVNSGPAVFEGLVCVGCDDHLVYALDARSGRQLWSYKTGGQVTASPTIANGVVFVGSHDHHLYALRAADGSILWRHKTGQELTTAPAVAADLVLVASNDQFLYALDAASGKPRWRHQTGGGRSSPTVLDGVVYVGSGGLGSYHGRTSKPALFEQANAWAFRARDGKLLWRYYLGTLSAAATPAVAEGLVLVSAAGSSSTTYTSTVALRASDGELIWTSATSIGGEYGVSAVVAP